MLNFSLMRFAPISAISRVLSALNVVPVLGLALLTVGVGLQFTWPIALIVAGCVMVLGSALGGRKGDA